MNLFLRLLLLLLTYRFRPRCEKLGPARKRFVVWPPDLDVLGHVNNGVYLSMLDVARVDWMLRSGMAGPIRERRYYPVVAAETIRFRKSLQLFQSFDVETRVLGWDERAFILQHRFLRGDELVAEAIVRARFLKRKGGTVTSAALLEAIGVAESSPALPEWISAWNRENAAR
ncbi:MAG: thioesterase superfamily protein [Polyangiaceae bacterium]|nr:thioesterase superfamily protein [Polyangiaceae bacterium]